MVFLVFFEIQDYSYDDQYVLKSCYIPKAVLNACNIHNNPTLVPMLTSLFLFIFNQKK